VRRELPVSHRRFGQLAPCETCRQVHRRRIARFDRVSSRRGRALSQRFHNFHLAAPATPATPAYNAALTFAAGPSGWLVIHPLLTICYSEFRTQDSTIPSPDIEPEKRSR
jgi:hypothetical protein